MEQKQKLLLKKIAVLEEELLNQRNVLLLMAEKINSGKKINLCNLSRETDKTEVRHFEMDFSKRVLKINGEDVSNKVSELHLDFENGEWLLTMTKTLRYNVSNQKVKE